MTAICTLFDKHTSPSPLAGGGWGEGVKLAHCSHRAPLSPALSREGRGSKSKDGELNMIPGELLTEPGEHLLNTGRRREA